MIKELHDSLSEGLEKRYNDAKYEEWLNTKFRVQFSRLELIILFGLLYADNGNEEDPVWLRLCAKLKRAAYQ